MTETEEQQQRRAERERRTFSNAIEFIGVTKAVVYNVTANPQLCERVEGHILTAPTKFEAAVELQRVAARVLTAVEACVFAALCEGRITEAEIHPQRLESIRTKCLREWRRTGLLPLNTFLNVSQNVLDAEEADAQQRREAEQQKRDAEQKEAERRKRIENAKLLRMRPRDRKRAVAKQRKEAA